VSYQYRVFIVHQANESTFLHLSAEPLRDGLTIEVERPGSELDGRPCRLPRQWPPLTTQAPPRRHCSAARAEALGAFGSPPSIE
jgi:hypothetical protein